MFSFLTVLFTHMQPSSFPSIGCTTSLIAVYNKYHPVFTQTHV